MYKLFTFFVLCLTQSVLATNYYVDGVNGNNSNSGLTPQTAFKTIQKAEDIMTAGDSCLVFAGNYTNRVIINTSGTSNSPIVYKAISSGAVTQGFTISAQYIHVIGFEVTSIPSNWGFPDSRGIAVMDDNNKVENNYIHEVFNEGIMIGDRDFSVQGCLIKANIIFKSGECGIEVSGDGNIVEDNNISRTQQWTISDPPGRTDADGIRFFGRNHIIRNNYIHDIYRSDPENSNDPHIDGFQTWGPAYDILIDGNIIFINSFQTTQIANLRDDNLNTHDLTIINNIGAHMYRGFNTWYIDNCEFYNNTFYDINDYPIELQNSDNAKFKNNVFIDTREVSANSSTGLEYDYNAYYHTNGSTPNTLKINGNQQPPAPHDLVGVNPLLVDINNNNFQLTANSPLIDAGANLSSAGVTTDILGTIRPQGSAFDISAFEYYSAGGNLPPNPPANPNPANGATNQPVSLTLSWTCTDPDGDPLIFDIYFGTNSDPPIVATGQSGTIYNPGTLNNSTTYYWKIVAKDIHGHSTTGSVWNFTTVSGTNLPPNPPSNPNPSNGATNQPISLTLSWSCTDPDGDPLTYDVYFGSNSNPPLQSSGQSAASFNPGTLTNSTTYYWKIVAKDNQGHSTTGSIWNFTTLSGINLPPNQPNNPNPPNNAVNQSVSINLTWDCSDPENDPLTYDLYFGTNTNPPLKESGLNVASYNPGTLANSTTFYWKIVAKDDHSNSTTGPIWNFETESSDITPPEVVDADILDSAHIYINFSEPLEQQSASNPANYAIDNGIIVTSAELQPNGLRVNLDTSPHTRGVTYTVTVSKVKDLAGNIISPTANSAQYFFEQQGGGGSTQLNIPEVIGPTQNPLFAPDKTIDGLGYYNGDPTSRWSYYPMPEDLIFNLSMPKNVTQTRLSFYLFQIGRTYEYSIEVSLDQQNWQQIVAPKYSETVEWTEDQFPAIEAQYIRVNFLGSTQTVIAGLWECQIWGEDLPTSSEITLTAPEQFGLYQNYPNPFNPSTRIRYEVPENTFVSLIVYDLLGNEIERLVNEDKTAGVYEVRFDAKDFASGIYIYRLTTENYSETKRMVFLK